MSKLKTIVQAFERHPNVVVFGPIEEKSFGESLDGGLSHNAHTVTYTVAPKVEIHSVSKLNEWFYGLIPNYKSMHPQNNDKFRISCDNLEFGHLRFDEKGIGHVERSIKAVEVICISDDDYLKGLKGFRKGRRFEVREQEERVGLGRMIMIYGCPNKKIAKTAFDAYNNGSFLSYIPSRGYTK